MRTTEHSALQGFEGVPSAPLYHTVARTEISIKLTGPECATASGPETLHTDFKCGRGGD
jgi:hypothetical protein